MIKVAIMGFGTVGSGVLEILRRNANSISKRAGEGIEVKYILDIRDFSTHPDAKLFTSDYQAILDDKEVKVFIETIGGTKPAYDFVKRALQSGRHVVTSNKELVATHGAELLSLAKQNKVCFLFEASVGGGTPIITPMHQCLAANMLSEIAGIVNGTTNFMLTKMAKENMGFDEALKIAQDLGYAETIDPSADVDGIDACRKISILASLAFGNQIHPQNVSADGIRKVTVTDIQNASKSGGAIRLIAWAKQNQLTKAVSCGVEPMLVSSQNQLAGVEDVFNAVLVKGDMLGDVVFYGKGAGKLPTASAVVADIIDSVRNGVNIHDSLCWVDSKPIDGILPDNDDYLFYIRATGISTDIMQAICGNAKLVSQEDGVAVLTQKISKQSLAAIKLDIAQKGGNVELVLKWLD